MKVSFSATTNKKWIALLSLMVLLFCQPTSSVLGQSGKSLGLRKLELAYSQVAAGQNIQKQKASVEEAIIALQQEDSLQLLVFSYVLMGTVQMNLGALDSTLYYQNLARKLNPVKSLGDSLMLSDILLLQFQLENFRGKPDQANESLKQVGEILESIDFDRDFNVFAGNIYKAYDVVYLIYKGDNYYNQKQYEKALYIHQIALSRVKSAPERYPAFYLDVINSKVANTLINAGRPELAVGYIKEALERIGDQDIPNKYNLYNQLGTIFADSQYDSAIFYTKKAISGTIKFFGPGNNFVWQSYGNLGSIYIRKNQPDSAAYYLKRFRKEANPRHHAELSSQVLLHQGKIDSAYLSLDSYYQTTLKSSEQTIDHQVRTIEYLNFLTQLQMEQLDRYGFNQTVFDQLIEKSLAAGSTMRTYKKLLNNQSASLLTYDSYLAIMSRLSRQEQFAKNTSDYPELVMGFLENMQSYRLAESIKMKNQKRNGISRTNQLVATERKVRELDYAIQKAEERQEINKMDSLKALFNEANLLLNVKRDSLGLVDQVVENLPGSVVWEQVQKLLSDSEVIVDFVQTHDLYLTFFITNRGIRLVRVDRAEAETHLAKILTWQGLPSGSFPEEAFQYVNQLFGSATIGSKNKLLIIPDGIFHAFSFDLLGMEKDNYLPSYEISYLPTISSLWLLRRPEKTKFEKEDITAFIVDHFDQSLISNDSVSDPLSYVLTRSESFRNLPGAKEEARRLDAIGVANIFQNNEVSKGQVLNTIPKTRIVHFASHALINANNPLLSYIVLGKEGSLYQRLESYEISNLEMDLDLVFLSACNTGVGSRESGEAVHSLANSFLMAGSRSVVMTQWRIPDETTPDIVANFYENLEKGMRKTEALLQAKRNYLQYQENPRYKHPYFWAGFVLIGDDSPMKTDRNPYFWWLVLTVLCIPGLFLLRNLVKKQ